MKRSLIERDSRISDDLLKKYTPLIFLANAEAHRFAITFHRKRLLKKML
jgi:excinuclease UvrABC nuclease subunit